MDGFEKTGELLNAFRGPSPVEQPKESVVTNVDGVTDTAKYVHGQIAKVISRVFEVQNAQGVGTHHLIVDGTETVRRAPRPVCWNRRQPRPDQPGRIRGDAEALVCRDQERLRSGGPERGGGAGIVENPTCGH
jgi:hypothetical protein